jgi:hypothetical protein
MVEKEKDQTKPRRNSNEKIQLAMTPVVEFDRLTSTLLVNVFKFKNNRLSVNNKFVRSVLGCQPGKPNLNFTHTDVTELPSNVYHRLFSKGDEDKIVRYLKSLTEKDISAREAKRNFDFWMTQTINESIRQYYNYLHEYDHLNERSTSNSQLYALENALMGFGYEYKGLMDGIGPLLQNARIRLGDCPKPFVFNKPKRKKWERWFLTHEPRLIPGILVKPTKGNFHKPADIPKTTYDLISLFYLRMRSVTRGFVRYEQLLINFVVDNPDLDKKKIFIVDSERIMIDLFWKGLENIKVSERKVGTIRERLESNLKVKIYLPFELICFAVYRFEFCGTSEENSVWTFENILVVYDQTTKFVIHRARLTGEPSDFETAVRVLIQEELKVPNLIIVDPQLSGYLDECRPLIDKLALPIQISPCSNFRLSHFFNFYVTRQDMFIKYMIVPDKNRRSNSYVVDTPKDVTYQECLERFLELAFDEFNTYDDRGSIDPGFRATPSNCYWRMRKGYSKEISRSEFALIFFDRVGAITEGRTLRTKVGTFILDFKLVSECFGKVVLLTDINQPEANAFVVTKSGAIIEAKYQGKFIFEEGGWEVDIGAKPLKILDVGEDSNKIVRQELDLPVDDWLDLAQLDKSRVLRKNYKILKNKIKQQ